MKRPKNAATVLAALLLLSTANIGTLFIASCATTTGDPIVVNAEKTTANAVDIIDTFLKIEYENPQLKQSAPKIHEYANYVRKNAPQWIATARNLTQTYKYSRTAENKVNLQTALSVLTAVITQSQQYLTQIKH